MSVLARFQIDLKNFPSGGKHFCYKVEDDFFEALEVQDVIRGGCVDVTLDVKQTAGVYALKFEFEGEVRVPCDRCLDDVELMIEGDGALRVKLGEEFADDGEMVTVPEREQTVNVAWNLYEFIALALPIKHTHEEGGCNAEMQGLLGNLGVDEVHDEDSDREEIEASEEETQTTDPRWDKLKDILKKQ